MNIWLNIVAIVPGLLIALLIYRADRYEKEQPLHLILCFVIGILVTFPSMYLEQWGASFGWEQSENLLLLFVFSVLVVGFSEEVTKYIVLVVYPYPRKFFNEPMDGIIYAVMIGMGFATLENLLYADRYGLDTILVRAFTAVPAHGVFSVISGYYVGLAKFQPQHRTRYLVLGFVLPILLHGIYDFWILQERHEWMMSFATLTLLVCGYWGWLLIKKHQHNSPFRTDAPHAQASTTDTSLPPPIMELPPTEPPTDTSNDIMDAVLKDLEE